MTTDSDASEQVAHCAHEVPRDYCGTCQRPRWKDYLAALWCLAFDWTDGLSRLYRGDKRGPLVWLGGQAQGVWFRAHNNPVYDWLDAPHDTLCGAVHPATTTGRPVTCSQVRGHKGQHSGQQYVDWSEPPTLAWTTVSTLAVSPTFWGQSSSTGETSDA